MNFKTFISKIDKIKQWQYIVTEKTDKILLTYKNMLIVLIFYVQDFSINGRQTIKFLDKDLEFLAGTGAGEGMDFYDIKDVIVNYECAG